MGKQDTFCSDPSASFNRFPKDPSKRAGRLRAFGIIEGQLRDHSRVCWRHFRDGDSTKEPLVMLGKRFASPIKGKHPRAKRAKAREAAKPITELSGPQSPGVSLSSSVTRRKEGPSKCGESSNTPSLPVQSGDAASPSQSTVVIVSSALLARIECLEAENSFLKAIVLASHSPSELHKSRIIRPVRRVLKRGVTL